MSDYRVGEGHDIALGSLTVLDPQPRSEGLKYTRTTYSASGLVYREKPYVELIWSMVESPTVYQSILEDFGLDALVSANVTVYVLDDQLTATRYNGRAIRPAIGRDGGQRNYFMRNVTIIVKDLTTPS